VHAFVGLAIAMPASGNILPTSVWYIHPSSSYGISSSPPPSFKLGIGSYEPGTLVQIQELGSQLASINFSSAAGKFCRVLHDANGLLSATVA
jgi:hypothetical protein